MVLPDARWAKLLLMAISYAVISMPLIFVFSAAGYVASAFQWMQDNDSVSRVCVVFGVLSAIVVVFLKVHRELWHHAHWLVRLFVGASVWLSITWSSLYFFSRFPAGALLLSQITFPAAVYTVRGVMRRHKISEVEHARLAFYALLANAASLLGAWLVWLLNTPSPWNEEFQAKYLGPLDCANQNVTNVQSFVTKRNCEVVFIAWAYPVLLMFSAITTALGVRVILHTIERVSANQDCEESAAQAFGTATRQALVSLIAGFSIVIIWMFAAHLSNLSYVADILAAMFIMDALMLMLVLTSTKNTRQALGRLIEAVPIVKNLPGLVTSDTLRGALALLLMPFVLLHISIHELVLKTCKGAFVDEQLGQEDGAAGGNNSEKAKAADDSRGARSASDQTSAKTGDDEVRVHWTNVLRKSVLMGVVYLAFVLVFGRLVNVILSAVNVALQSVSLAIVCFVYLVLGTLMLVVGFPGGPVYVTGGLIVTNAGEASLGFWGGFAVSCAVCMGVKVCGVTIQQKVIGEQLGKYTSVRSMVGINTLTIRAIRYLLSQKGMSFAKVCILCGGPDWPTSVLTGILHLQLSEMLLGTLPVIFLIAPCCLAGAVITKAGDPAYQTLDVVAKMLGIAAQTAGLMAAMYFIEREVHDESSKLVEMYPDDEVVKALEKKAEKEQELERTVTDWDANALSQVAKTCLLLASFTMSIACYIITLVPKRCFLSFAVTDTVEGKLRGKVWNLIRCDLAGDDLESSCKLPSNAAPTDDTVCLPGKDCWGGGVMILFMISLLLYAVFLVFKFKLMAAAQKPTWRGITRKSSRAKMVV